MKALTTIALLIVSPIVYAAGSFPAMNIRALLWDLFVLVGIGIIAGIVYALVDQAPFINAMFKTILKYAVLLIVGIFIIYLILGWIGM